MANLVTPPVEETLKQFNIDPTLAEDTALDKKAAEGGELTTEEKEAIAAEIVQIDAALERLTERKEAIKEQLRSRLDYGTTVLHKDAGVSVTVGHNSQLDKERVEATYPYDRAVIEKQVVQVGRKDKVVEVTTYPNRVLYKITPDPTAIKKHLPEEDVVDPNTGEVTQQGWRALYNEGAKKIGFR